MPALLRLTARTTLAASARLPVSVQCGNSRLTKMPSGFARSHSLAKRAVVRSRSGSGSCAMMCCAPSSAVGLELRNEIFRLERGIHAEELAVVHGDAGGGEPRLRFLHQRPVARQVVQHLVRRDPRHPQAHVAVAGARGHVDDLRRRQRQHRQVRERVIVLHGDGSSVPVLARARQSACTAPSVLTWCTFLPGE